MYNLLAKTNLQNYILFYQTLTKAKKLKISFNCTKQTLISLYIFQPIKLNFILLPKGNENLLRLYKYKVELTN